MSDDLLSSRQKIALAAALGTGIVVGAAGVAVYHRLSQVDSDLSRQKCAVFKMFVSECVSPRDGERLQSGDCHSHNFYREAEAGY